MFLEIILSANGKINVIHNNILPRCILFLTNVISCDLFGDNLMVAE